MCVVVYIIYYYICIRQKRRFLTHYTIAFILSTMSVRHNAVARSVYRQINSLYPTSGLIYILNIYIYICHRYMRVYKTWFFHFVTARKRADVFFSTVSGNPLLWSTRWWTTRKRFSKLFPCRVGRYLQFCQSRITPYLYRNIYRLTSTTAKNITQWKSPEKVVSCNYIENVYYTLIQYNNIIMQYTYNSSRI